MPTAKPPYDKDGTKKYRSYTDDERAILQKKVQCELKGFYPDKNAETCDYFGHPADAWANSLFITAYDAIVTTHSHYKRPTNEELKAEHQDILTTLKKTESSLQNMSDDLRVLFDTNTGDTVRYACLDKIKALIQHIEPIKKKIPKLPRAMTQRKAEHQAALEMTARVSHILEDVGIPMSATADPDLERYSDAVKILKILGENLGLWHEETTWKDTINQSKKDEAKKNKPSKISK